MTRTPRRGAIAAASLVGFSSAVALAQSNPSTPPGGGAVQPAAPQPIPQPGSTYVPTQASGNPQAANGTIGGGNATESSAHPRTGEEEDSFDLGPRGRGQVTAHGDDTSPVFTAGPSYGGGELPQAHIVRHGDTLWAIGGYYFRNPYQWPRLWSYNPQIKNPNWIYPGDEVRLRSSGPPEGATAGGPVLQMGQTGRRPVSNDTVFLRDQGWIRDDTDDVWGEVSGAAEDKMFLSDFDVIYLHIEPGHDVHLGQELTIFLPVHPSAEAGTVVQIQGTARIDQWNSRDRVARAELTESLNVVERGARIGPLARRFEIVPPRRNEIEVQAHVLASVHPNEFYAQNQVVFIDKGEAAGLKLGNRLFVVRRGDPWRRSLVEPSAGNRVSPDDDKPLPPMESTPGSSRDDRVYPDEVVGELRVVATKRETATCVVTQSTVEIERSDLAVARSGY